MAAMPGSTIGTTTVRRVRARLHPSMDAASSTSTGTSARKDRIIHTAIGRFIEVYRMISNQMLSSIPMRCAIR